VARPQLKPALAAKAAFIFIVVDVDALHLYHPSGYNFPILLSLLSRGLVGSDTYVT